MLSVHLQFKAFRCMKAFRVLEILYFIEFPLSISYCVSKFIRYYITVEKENESLSHVFQLIGNQRTVGFKKNWKSSNHLKAIVQLFENTFYVNLKCFQTLPCLVCSFIIRYLMLIPLKSFVNFKLFLYCRIFSIEKSSVLAAGDLEEFLF